MTAIRHATATDRGVGIFDKDLLTALIIEANGSFESDRGKAKRCIERAAELIRDKQSEEPRESWSVTSRGGLTAWRVRQLRVYIESNIGAKISTTSLAALVSLSSGHFVRSFKASFGVSPQAYIRRRRIRRAEVLMASSHQPLADIALDCGLSDQAHFSRVFRRVVGVTPSDWRRRINICPVDDARLGTTRSPASV